MPHEADDRVRIIADDRERSAGIIEVLAAMEDVQLSIERLSLGDYAVENGLHGWFTAAPRFGVPQLYAVSAGCSLLKWALMISFAVAMALALWRTES